MPRSIQKRLQVFVSSNTELIEERQMAFNAILAAGHIPAGMELATAGDESRIDAIEEWIEKSDVHLLILDGRYGSIEPNTGKSYIQLEYEYALKLGKPVFALVISDGALKQRIKTQGESANEAEHPEKLQEFRGRVLQRMCGFWNDSRDIAIITGRALAELSRRYDFSERNDEYGSLSIFLCHSSNDKPVVRKLYRQLKDDKFDPWLDEEKLLPGQDWQLEIPKAVRNADVVIVCLSQGSVNKAGYVQKEIKYALDIADEQPEGTIFLIPLRLEECKVPDRLNNRHWVNYYEENGYGKLLKALQARAQSLSIEGYPEKS